MNQASFKNNSLYATTRSRHLHDQFGIYMPIMAILLVSLIAVCGLAIDSANLFLAQLRLQRVLDASALASLKMLNDKPNEFVKLATQELVQEALAEMGYNVPLEDINVDVTGRRVTVQANMNVNLYLMNILPGFGEQSLVAGKAVVGQPSMAVQLVLDVTGSMGAITPCSDGSGYNCTRLDELKKAARAFVEELNPNSDSVGLVAFSGGIVQSLPIQLLSDQMPNDPNSTWKNVLLNQIDALSLQGNTCISCGLAHGLTEIQAFQEEYISENQFVPKLFMVLFTDGSPNRSIIDTQKNAQNAWDAALPIPYRCWMRGMMQQNSCNDILFNSNISTLGQYANPAQHQWEAIYFANQAAIMGVTTYVVVLGDTRYNNDYNLNCMEAQCPFDFSFIEYRSSPSSAHCPTQENPIKDDPFEMCYCGSVSEGSIECDTAYTARTFFARRLANDPAMFRGNFDPEYPYGIDIGNFYSIGGMPTAAECQGETECQQGIDLSKRCRYRNECLHRVGPEFPQGRAFITPSASELSGIFVDVVKEILSKARLVE
jgi:Flp pilus assembly protein TadG